MSDGPDTPTPPPPGDAPPPPPAAPPPPPSDAPPPPASTAPPPPPASAGGPPAGGKSDNTAMLVLAYLWLLCLIPLLVEKDDAEVQWHAKHGLVWLIAEIIVWVAVGVLVVIPVIQCLAGVLFFILPPAALVLRILAIVKATKGERFLIPGLSPYADKL